LFRDSLAEPGLIERLAQQLVFQDVAVFADPLDIANRLVAPRVAVFEVAVLRRIGQQR